MNEYINLMKENFEKGFWDEIIIMTIVFFINLNCYNNNIKGSYFFLIYDFQQYDVNRL